MDYERRWECEQERLRPYETIREFVGEYTQAVREKLVYRHEVRRLGYSSNFMEKSWGARKYVFRMEYNQYYLKEINIRERDMDSTNYRQLSGSLVWSRLSILDIFKIGLDPSIHGWVMDNDLGFKWSKSGLYHWEKYLKKDEDLKVPPVLGQYLKELVQVIKGEPRFEGWN